MATNPINPDATARVEIEYCARCGFLPRATWLAQELLNTFSLELRELALVPGQGGILEVRESGGVYDADMRCTAEGTTSDQTIRMLVQGDNLDLTYVSAGGGKVQLKRCADPQVTVDQPVG